MDTVGEGSSFCDMTDFMNGLGVCQGRTAFRRGSQESLLRGGDVALCPFVP